MQKNFFHVKLNLLFSQMKKRPHLRKEERQKKVKLMKKQEQLVLKNFL